MKRITLTLEDLGLGIFHDRSSQVKLWLMVESNMSEEEKRHKYVDFWTDRLRILRDKRMKKVYEMRQQGHTYRVIGETFNVSVERARQLLLKYKRALERTGEYE